MVDADEPERRARLAELQRRLYRPDAMPEDLAEYTALRDEVAAVESERAAAAAATIPVEDGRRPDLEAEQPRPDVRRRSRPLLIVGALAGVAALAAVVALLQTPGQQYEPVAQASTTAPSLPAVQLQGRKPYVSERFTDDGSTPQGTTVEVAVDGTRVLAQRFSGSGPSVVPLITGGAPLDGGLLTVTLESANRSSVGWEASSPQGSSSPRSTLLTPTTRRSSNGSTSVEYRGAPPAAISVSAPEGTGWTLVVAFSR